MHRHHVVPLFQQPLVDLCEVRGGRLRGRGQVGQRLEQLVEPVGADVNAVAVCLRARVHVQRHDGNVAGQGRIGGKIRAAVGDDSYGHETSFALLRMVTKVKGILPQYETIARLGRGQGRRPAFRWGCTVAPAMVKTRTMPNE